MEEEKIKQTFSRNLINLRKGQKLTQVQLAEKLNYSDKSVSKWECGDVLPDIVTFTAIAEYFGVSVDSLVTQPVSAKFAKTKRNAVIILLTFGLTWFVASIIFFILYLLNVSNAYFSYIVAMPVSVIAPLVLCFLWFKNNVRAMAVSLLVWTFAASFYVLTLGFGNFWFVFVLAAIFQLLTVWWFLLRHYINLSKQNNKQQTE